MLSPHIAAWLANHMWWQNTNSMYLKCKCRILRQLALQHCMGSTVRCCPMCHFMPVKTPRSVSWKIPNYVWPCGRLWLSITGEAPIQPSYWSVMEPCCFHAAWDQVWQKRSGLEIGFSHPQISFLPGTVIGFRKGCVVRHGASSLGLVI